MVEGVGGKKGGGGEEKSAADRAVVERDEREANEEVAVAVAVVFAVRLKARDGARLGMTCGSARHELRFSSSGKPRK